MEATKSIEEMSDAEIGKAIKDEIPFICYRDIYRPVISERLKQNESYCRVKQLYTEAANVRRTKMVKVTPKLKRCPFCGGIPRTRRLTKGIFKKRNYFYIVCLTCGATTRVQNTEEEVCGLWNNRTCTIRPVPDGKGATAQIIEGATE